MKNIIVLMMVTLLVSGCGIKTATVEPDIDTDTNMDRGDGSDVATSGMVDDAYFLTGELKEINDNQVLIKSDEADLVWVSMPDPIDDDITIHSLIKIQFSGDIAESYPGQATGSRIEVIELFVEDALYTAVELTDMIEGEEANHVVVWNSTKDVVAYASVDMVAADGSYHVYVANIYEENSKEVAFVINEIPDLNWFYDRLEVQTSQGSIELGPDFEGMTEVIEIQGEAMVIE